jgi:hypothetical protein
MLWWGSFVCFIVVLEHNKHELPQNYVIVSSIILDQWKNAFIMFGEDMSSCCVDADGSSIFQFQLLFAAWIISVHMVTLQITLNKFGGIFGSINCKNAKLIRELSLCSRVQFCVLPGDIHHRHLSLEWDSSQIVRFCIFYILCNLIRKICKKVSCFDFMYMLRTRVCCHVKRVKDSVWNYRV